MDGKGFFISIFPVVNALTLFLICQMLRLCIELVSIGTHFVAERQNNLQ